MSSPATFADWRDDQRSFTALASYNNVTLTFTGAQPALPLAATSVSAEWTDVLGVSPATRAAPASASPWCVRSSNCTAAT
jgi:hypothetical protein